MKTPQDRTPFKVRSPHQFNLYNHRPIQLSPKSKKLMPTIIRLARLMSVAAPEKKVHFALNSQEELEVQIRAFRYLVNEHHFPLIGYEGDDEFMDETIGQWMGEWIDQTYHPLLNQMPVHPMAIANHDIQPTDYGDLVALIYWLATINPSPPNLVCGQAPNLIWDRESKDEFRFMPMGAATTWGWYNQANNVSKVPLTQANLRCNKLLKPSSLQRIPTPLNLC